MKTVINIWNEIEQICQSVGLPFGDTPIFFFNMLILLLHSEVLTRGGRKPLQLFDSRSLE